LGSLVGKLSIHQIKIDKRELEFIKRERVSITPTIVLSPDNVSALTVHSNEGLTYRCASGQFYNMHLALKNHHTHALKLQLVIKPCIRFGKGLKQMDLSKLMWVGTFEHLISKLGSGEATQHSISFAFLSSGFYTISLYCIDPASPPESSLASISYVNILVS